MNIYHSLVINPLNSNNFRPEFGSALVSLDSAITSQAIDDAMNSVIAKFPDYIYKSPQIMAVAWYIHHKNDDPSPTIVKNYCLQVLKKDFSKKDLSKLPVDVAGYYERLSE